MRQGRFGGEMAAQAAALNASVGFDRRLYTVDIRGSQAHARMLAKQGIVTPAEAETICRGLDQVRDEIERGALALDPKLEDIHMNVERRLTEIVGEVGGKLHTARSRNDQVATDLKLWAREQGRALASALDVLRSVLVAQARAHLDVIVPGYTHLQRAQPIRLAHHLLAYVDMLARDRGRVADAVRRAGASPLGAGALAGTSFPIDRAATASALGFEELARNSMDAVSDRDFAVELLAACALVMVHLSRLGEELVLWASQEFGFVKLPEGYCSGSSIMPQKVNPDIPELVRAKTGRVTGDLVALLVVLKGLPLAYNKDLQETQEPLYDALETTIACARVMAGLMEGVQFDAARMAAACESGHVCATEIADFLAARGVPFRRAHDIAGILVKRALERGLELRTLPLEEYRAAAPELDPSIYEALDPARAVERRAVVGGPARAQVLAEIERIEKELADASL
ncbi:MAG TPA: argininosuccinate lyase [Polyangia bacterium]|nr:argininosuccinate lyase [Polyangia bacterium]